MIENQSQPSSFDPSSEYGSIEPSEFRTDNITAGMLLQEAREASGLHIDSLAVALKVPVKKLEALEMDRYDLLPDAVFARALAASVCRTLKVDPAPIMALLPTSGLPAFHAAPIPQQTSFTAFHSGMKSRRRASISAPAAAAGILLVLAAAVVLFLPEIRTTAASLKWPQPLMDGAQQWVGRFTEPALRRDAAGDSAAEVPVPGIVEVAGPKSALDVSPVAAGLTPSDRLGDSSLTAGSGDASRGQASTFASAQQAPSVVGGPAALKSSRGLSATDSVVAFTTTGQSSWVKVTDARGAVVFSRTLTPGEEASAAGALPLSVVVGRADATRVTVRGVAFDLSGYARENVARFEVK